MSVVSITDTYTTKKNSIRGQWTIPRSLGILLGAITTLFFSGGLILGYGPFYAVLVQEGQWHELCHNNNESENIVCSEQQGNLQSIFTTGFLLLSLGNAVFGILLDVVGPRLCVSFGFVLSIIGNVFVAYGDSTLDRGYMFLVGYGLIAAGGMGVYISVFQFSNLFSKSGLPCSILSAFFNVSGYIYIAMKYLPITRQSFFISYSILATVGLSICFLLYPDQSILSQNSTYEASGISCPNSNIKASKRFPIGEIYCSVRQQLRKAEFWIFTIFFGWHSAINAYTGGAIPNLISKYATADESDLEDNLINLWFPVISNATFLVAPVVGWLIDHHGFTLPITICIASTQCFLLSLFVQNLSWQIVSLVLFCISQAFLYTLQFSFIMKVFPGKIYGSLQTVVTMFSFLLGFSSYLFTYLTESVHGGDIRPALTILLVPTILFYYFPYYHLRCEYEKERRWQGRNIGSRVSEDSYLVNET